MKQKAELWDKMQYIMEKYNDHTMHSFMEFKETLDYEVLEKAYNILNNEIPIFKARFKSGLFKAEWKKEEESNEKGITFIKASSGAKEISFDFLTKKVNEKKEPQFQVLLVRQGKKDILNIICNHMVMDGADFKQVIALFAKIYSNLKQGKEEVLSVKKGSRSFNQLTKTFTKEQKQEIKALKSYSKASNSAIGFPYETKDKSKIKPFIEVYKTDKELFKAAKAKGKEQGFTLNDIIVASLFRALKDEIIIQQGKSLGIPCMIDLRKYIEGGETEGYTNFTSMVIVNIGEDVGETITETTKKVNEAMKKIKKDWPGLHGLPLLDLAFKIFPFAIAKLVIGNFFKNPLIGMSNIGIIEEESIMFDNIAPADMFLTGSIKYPPYIQYALTTYKQQITFSVASYGTDKDILKIRKTLYNIEKELKEYVK